MKAVLLAAGEGTRLRPLTTVVPKCLMPIQGVPLLQIWLTTLERMGISEILVNTHYMAALVTRFLERTPAKPVVTYEPRLLGTAGTLIANGGFASDDDVLVAHADNLSLFDASGFASAFERRPKAALVTMMTFETDDPSSCGIVETNSNGLVAAFHEKVATPPSNLANAAIYVFSKEAVTELLARPDLTDLSTEFIPRFLGRMNTFHNDVYHRDVGNVSSYVKGVTDLVERRLDVEPCAAWRELADDALWSRWVASWKSIAPSLRAHETAAAFLASPAPSAKNSIDLVRFATKNELRTLANRPFDRVLPFCLV